jgi:pimeloyl-ACP methyl ester carboxylesterase
METANSKDGTTIAYDQRGDGPPLILVGGAFNDRHSSADLADALAADFTAVTYDRRGRGDSDDTLPYAVERELDDLEAVISAVGGPAFVHGMSSGAVLAFRAAAAGASIIRLSAIEPPFRVADAPPAPPDYVATLVELTSTGRRGEAAEYFMTAAVGLPPEAVAEARRSPMWPSLEAMAPTLVYDALVMDDNELPTALLSAVAIPTLVVHSTSSPAWLRAACAATAEALPNARHLGLDGTFHRIPPETLAPTLTAFFTGREDLSA